MSSESPAVVLYDSLGNPLAVQSGIATPTSTPGIMIAGSDGTNSRFILVDGSGREVMVGPGTAGTPTGGVLSIQGVSSGTAVPISGTVTSNAGTGNFNVIGTGTAGAAATGVITIQGIAGGVTVPISGTVTATNPSVGAPAAAPPTNATYVGGLVNTSAPSGYTNGDLYPLSLNTGGGLRVDGSGVTQPVSGTVTVTGTVTANAGTGTFNIAGTGTAGSPGTAVLTIQGVVGGTAIPVSGTFTTDKASTSSLTSVAASVTSVSLLAINANRVLATVWNDSTSQAYVALASTASATAYTIKLFPGAYWELPLSYTGAISAIWVSANGNMRVSELTP